MEMILYLTLLMVATLSSGNEMGMMREEEVENDNKVDKEESIAFETYGTPYYGVNNGLKAGGLNGKSAYNTPVSTLPPGYAAYLASLGFSNSYAYGPYNRYSSYPYPVPSSYGYGAPLLNNPAYGSALLSGLGYAGYGSPYLGRSMYPGFGYGYPGYTTGLGYRYGGLGYAPAALRGGPVPIGGVPAPVAGVPPPVSRLSAPVTGIAPPVPAVPNGIPGVPVPLPVVQPYRQPFRPVQGKDGTVRYGYAPVDVQALPAY